MGLVDELFVAAVEDRRRGAVEIERRLIDGLLRERARWTPESLVGGAARLLEGQPTMANLRTLARRLVEEDLAVIETRLESRAAALRELDDRLAAAAWPLIDGCARCLTLSRSSAVAAALTGAWRRGWRGSTVVFDGSPVGRGLDQASALAAVMEGVRSQPDAMMPACLEGGGDLVLIGADAVSPLRIVNACGTAILLELAAARSVPVIVVADSAKDLPDAELDVMLDMGPEAVEEGSDRRWPVFEPVSSVLVTNRVRE
jgi:translation initiation factor 2B subunit (eIF-2B alpha/beta/delta family)